MQKSSKRLVALDGLRGLAILAVILTHIPTGALYTSTLAQLHLILSIVFGSGGIGVYIFFLLTGFLMGSIYPYPNQALAFWGKRYARLFPPFLVMVFSFTVIRLIGKTNPLTELLIILTTAFFARGIWELCLKIRTKIPIGRILLICFLVFQAGVAIWYSFFLLRVPPAVYYQIWNIKIQDIITGVVNGTLTLPFGNYIGQLDGVYWTLASEVLFYLLYPLLLIPLLYFIKTFRSIKLKSFLFLLLLPLCFGIYLINLRLLGFEILKLHLIIYFISGVIIGLNSEWFIQKASKSRLFFNPVSVMIMLLGVFGSLLIYPSVPRYFHAWIQILIIFPASLLLIMAIVEKSPVSRFLGQRTFTFFGKYSYSLYLTHAFVIGSTTKYISQVNLLSSVFLIAVSVTASIILSIILYHLIEAPYFNLKKAVKSKIQLRQNNNLVKYPSKQIFTLTLSVLILLYLGFKPPLATFTYSYRHSVPHFLEAIVDEKAIPVREKPVKQTFTALFDNLGMITIRVRNRGVPGINSAFVPSRLLIRLLDKDNKIIAESSYNAFEIIDSRYHPFGFPPQADSKGKQYSLEFQLTQSNPAQELELVTNEGSFISVYFPSKKDLLKNPLIFGQWLTFKFLEPFSNPMFWFTLVHVVSFLSLLIYLMFLKTAKKY